MHGDFQQLQTLNLFGFSIWPMIFRSSASKFNTGHSPRLGIVDLAWPEVISGHWRLHGAATGWWQVMSIFSSCWQ
jgi:hypothetical protein